MPFQIDDMRPFSDDPNANEYKRPGILQRDLLKLLPFIDTLECKGAPARVLTLAAAIASVAYVHNLSKDKAKQLADLMIDGFDPETK